MFVFPPHSLEKDFVYSLYNVDLLNLMLSIPVPIPVPMILRVLLGLISYLWFQREDYK